MTGFRRWWWILLLILIGIGLTRLRLDVEVLNLLPQSLPAVQGLKTYQENFSNARELIIAVKGDAEDVETAARTLAQALRRQTNLASKVIWQPLWLEYPGQSAELIAYLWYNQPPESFAGLANRLDRANLTNVLLSARERLATTFSPADLALLAYDPLELTRLPGATNPGDTGEQLFVSEDGTFRVLFVEANSPLANYKQCRAWLDNVKDVVARQSLPTGITIGYTGRPAFVTEIAGGMERDMTGSAGGTLLTIGVLFYLTHRRLRPLLWLLALLLSLLAATTAIGAFFFGTLNVVSLGFAAILLGLAEDFGIVLYQESRSHPELSTAEVRRHAAPGIWWSAVTTAGAFLLLNLSGLPGLGQLGSLVAIGILLAAVVMIYAYVPPLMRWHRKSDPSGFSERLLLFAPVRLLPAKWIWTITTVLLLAAAFILWQPRARFDRSPEALKPRNSGAYAAVEEIKQRLGHIDDPVWVMVHGANEEEVARRLRLVEPWLSRGVTNRAIASFTLPNQLWPHPENQRANRAALGSLAGRADELRRAILSHGFTTNSVALTENLFAAWRTALAHDGVYWPSNAASRWAVDRIFGKTSDGILALGLIQPAESRQVTRRFIESLPPELRRENVIISGWEFIGPTIFELVVRELPRVTIPIAALVLISLWLAFRDFKAVLLSLATLAFSGLAMQAIMDLAGWRWNLLNLMGIPLLLGIGVDYSIHIQLALRRYGGDLAAARKSVGRALLLAGTTTVVGFGSLSFSTNAGMSSLGKVCALGIGLALLTAVYLLPVWWRSAHRL
ncbi:MAG: MMPL family transporter [Verrucomicrobia subdivision 3 bacterium]|nr:MMPL family transporter [Limisphaerales bacterium]